MATSPDGAGLAPVAFPPASPTAVVLVLHGGGADSFAPARWRNLAVLRLWPIARVIAREVSEVTVVRLKFSIRGWNGDGTAALRDGRWALGTLRREHPGLPIVIVGHSMGARVAARLGGDSGVAGIVLLAPWTPSGDPTAQLAGVPVVVVQGGRDRMIPEPTTRPWMSRAKNEGALLQVNVLPWAGHTMLRRFWVWHRLAADGVRTVLAESKVLSSSPPRPPSP